jgi:uncharacterized protein YoxC
MIKKIGAVVALGGFVSLVISINQILHKGMATLEETNKTLAEVRNSVRGLTKESREVIHTANQISKDVQSKIDLVDPLLESVHDVGEIIHNATHLAKISSETTANKAIWSEPGLNQTVQIKIGEKTQPYRV